MRCLALAQPWSETGGRAVFSAAALSPSLRRRLVEEGFGCVTLDAGSRSNTDADATVAAVMSLGARVIVLNGYQFPVEFPSALA